MKLTKLVAFARDLRVLLFFVLGSLSLQTGFASSASITIELEGRWSSETKGLPSIPFTSSIAGSVLCIMNSSLDSDITIIIKENNGEIVYEQKAPAVNTANICIPTDTFPAGEYTLELISPSGNYLRGNFILCP